MKIIQEPYKIDYSSIESLVRKAGKTILEAKLTDSTIHDKQGPANFVTDYDILIQQELIAGLRIILPEASFFGEEDTEGNSYGSNSNGSNSNGSNSNGNMSYDIGGYCFYIDPIDGTTNFMFDYHHSCVSLGLSFQGQMLAGFVYNPYVDEMYMALRGKGAFLNGKKLSLSGTSLSQGIAAFGCARYNDDHAEKIFQIVRELFMRSTAVRNGGSAALDLCRIASGSNVCYFELKLQPYDYAAASLIIKEAGGKITQADGSPITLDKPCSIVGGTVSAHKEVLEIMKKEGV